MLINSLGWNSSGINKYPAQSMNSCIILISVWGDKSNMLKTVGTLTHTRSELSTTENPVCSLPCNSVKHCDKTSKNDQLSPALAIMSLIIYEKRQSIQTCLLQYSTVTVSKKSRRLTNYCYQTYIINRYSQKQTTPCHVKENSSFVANDKIQDFSVKI